MIKSWIKEKTCNICQQWKPLEEFYTQVGYSRTGRQGACIKCTKERDIERKTKDPLKYSLRLRKSGLKKLGVQIHGLEGWITETLEKQNNMCAMPDCNKERSNNGRILSVDHCHTTKKLRGLLCNECNIALGFYEKNKYRHSLFEEYLQCTSA